MNARTKLRHKLKLRFIQLHRTLFEKIPDKHYGEHHSETGREIAEKARKKIGFKSGYTDQDLFSSLMNFYNTHKNE